MTVTSVVQVVGKTRSSLFPWGHSSHSLFKGCHLRRPKDRQRQHIIKTVEFARQRQKTPPLPDVGKRDVHLRPFMASAHTDRGDRDAHRIQKEAHKENATNRTCAERIESPHSLSMTIRPRWWESNRDLIFRRQFWLSNHFSDYSDNFFLSSYYFLILKSSASHFDRISNCFSNYAWCYCHGSHSSSNPYCGRHSWSGLRVFCISEKLTHTPHATRPSAPIFIRFTFTTSFRRARESPKEHVHQMGQLSSSGSNFFDSPNLKRSFILSANVNTILTIGGRFSWDVYIGIRYSFFDTNTFENLHKFF